MAAPKTTAAQRMRKSIVKNRRASFDYAIEETYEAGLVLMGGEVKSLRAGKSEIVDAWVSVDNGEAWLKQMYIAPFEMAVAFPLDARRPRKLLMHGHEIEKIQKAVARGGYTVIPVEMYFVGSRVKVSIGLAKGKKTYDKRHAEANKTASREAQAEISRGRKGYT